MTDDNPLRIHPPLRTCLRYGLVLIPMIVGALLAFDAIADAILGRPYIRPLLLAQMAAFSVGLGVVLGVVVYATLLPWTWTIGADGIAGRSFWWRRQRIGWHEVTKVAPISFEGIPALVVSAAAKGREVYAYTLGVDLEAIHTRLLRDAGPDHPLTRAFAGAAT